MTVTEIKRIVPEELYAICTSYNKKRIRLVNLNKKRQCLSLMAIAKANSLTHNPLSISYAYKAALLKDCLPSLKTGQYQITAPPTPSNETIGTLARDIYTPPIILVETESFYIVYISALTILSSFTLSSFHYRHLSSLYEQHLSYHHYSITAISSPFTLLSSSSLYYHHHHCTIIELFTIMNGYQ